MRGEERREEKGKGGKRREAKRREEKRREELCGTCLSKGTDVIRTRRPRKVFLPEHFYAATTY